MNPFPGLRAFEQEDAGLFFGREEVVDRLLDRLASNRLLAVIGSSGSGKSSLVRAGLVPALASGFLGKVSRWKFVAMRPGTDPVGNLARAMEMGGMHEAEATLRTSSQGLVDLVRRDAEGSSYLIIVDQFEEIFRFQHYASTEDHEFFAALLTAAAASADASIYVVLTMRGDFFGDLAALPRLPEALSDSLVLMPRMTRLQIREAIGGPVEYKIEDSCVQRLLNDIEGTPDSLVRMQHALTRMWDAWRENGRDRLISLEDYEKIGGIASALNQHAEMAFNELEATDHDLAGKIFQLLSEEESGRIVRRPRRFADLVAMSGGSAERVKSIVAHFSRQRFLMPPDADHLGEGTVIDLAHEALLRNWRRLADLTAEESAARNFYLRLAERAEGHSQGFGSLMRGPELEQAERWWKSWNPHEAWAAKYQADFPRVRNYLERSRRARRVRTLTFATLAGALILLLIGAAAVYLGYGASLY